MCHQIHLFSIRKFNKSCSCHFSDILLWFIVSILKITQIVVPSIFMSIVVIGSSGINEENHALRNMNSVLCSKHPILGLEKTVVEMVPFCCDQGINQELIVPILKPPNVDTSSTHSVCRDRMSWLFLRYGNEWWELGVMGFKHMHLPGGCCRN